MAINKAPKRINRTVSPFQMQYKRFSEYDTVQDALACLYKCSEDRSVLTWGHGGLCMAVEVIDKLIDEGHFKDMIMGDTSEKLISLANEIESLKEENEKLEDEKKKLEKMINSDRMAKARAGKAIKKEK